MTVMIDGRKTDCPEDTTLKELADREAGKETCPAALAYMNGRLTELFHRAEDGARISFVTVSDGIGYETMRRSCTMLFLAAADRVLGHDRGRAVLHFSIGHGFFFTFGEDVSVNGELLDKLAREMQSMTDAKLRFIKQSVPTDEAKRKFAALGLHDKERLFRTRIASDVNIYRLGTFEDYFYGYMVYDASVLTRWSLIAYHGGIVMQMPARGCPDTLPDFRPSEKLMNAQLQGEAWAEKQHIGTVGELNAAVIRGDVSRMVLVSEALQESAISDLAKEIAERGGVKFVMIAGPSSSGKTTFSQRLMIQLAAHGMTPHYIGTDNYFRNRSELKPGPDGKPDFESLDALDVEAFGRDMNTLLEGGTVNMPVFDFVSGRRILSGEMLTLREGEMLVIEGIHGLNDELCGSIPKDSRFRIYISALTQLNLDEHNRVPSGDGRLIRRIVRDYRTRGYSASQTLGMWRSVRNGEEKYIFPFQESADAFFNSALPYEIAALKTFVQPLLFQVGEDDPSYYEAKRLLKFLEYVIAIPPEDIPMNSLIREFIGGGCFHL